MPSRIAALLTTLVLVTACVGESPLENESNLVVFNSALLDGDIYFDNDPSTPTPGVWIEKDGSRFCNGYLTRNEGVDYCSATVPKDWRPFTYDGFQYYYQPLSGQ